MNSQQIISYQKAEIFALMEESIKIGSKKNFIQLIRKTENLFHADHSICFLAKSENEQAVGFENIINISFPQEWIDFYISRNYSEIDPIFKYHFKEFKPQIWSEALGQLTESNQSLINQPLDFNFINGITFGMAIPRTSNGSLFSFSMPYQKIHHSVFDVLKILTPYLHQAMLRIVDLSPKKDDFEFNISNREKQVLNWIGAGKTNWEISMILGISEQTVKFHVSNILRKLNATTRSHAIFISMQANLLERDLNLLN